MIVYGINETIYGENLLQRMAHHMHFKMDLAVVLWFLIINMEIVMGIKKRVGEIF